MYKYEYKVKWADTDAAGIVYYPNFYKWTDEATAELFSSIGFPLPELFCRGIGTPILETQSHHIAPAFFGDELTIELNVVELKDKTVKFHHQIYRKETLLAEVNETRAFVDMLEDYKIKARSIPGEIRVALQRLNPLLNV